jgi:hypothetical protein
VAERVAATVHERMRPRAVAPGELAWVLLLPCAALTAAAVALLGGPLGHALLRPGSERFFVETMARPEPTEHGRYAVALLGPPLLSAAALASPRWLTTRDASLRRVVVVAQVALVAFLALCLAGQNDILLNGDRPELWTPTRYFTLPTLLVALALPAAALVAPRAPRTAARLASMVRETPRRRAACLAVAALFAAIWLLTAVDTDGSLANTATGVQGHILWSMDETFAILDGRTPFVNYHPEYGQLWPYIVAAAMAAIGTSIGVYTTIMVAASGLVLLAVYGILRRVARSSVLALALFGPVVATGFFMKLGPLDNRYGSANLFSLWPVRYGGAYLLAWLLSRRLDGAGPQRLVWLFLVGGLAVLNNPEFGVPALVATVVALVLVDPPRTRRAGVRLAASAAGGLLVALALVTALTLIRSGSLPRLGLLLEFPRLYGIGGWAMLPLPRIGIYLGVYVTFAAALVVAAVRRAQGAGEPVLTAMLAWIGAFGLLAGSYFVGRSHPQVLMDLFSPWTLALALLLVVVVRGLTARGWRRPAPAELAVLFGFGLAVCSLAQTPTPWSQIARIRDRAPTSIFKQRSADTVVARTSSRGEKVAILIPLGHRIAYDTGRVNVSPYSSIESMPTRQQLADTIADLRAAHGNKLYVSLRFTFPDEYELLLNAGFTPVARGWEPTGGQLVELIDRRTPHAR